jgi:hypothetical protein
VTLDARSGGPLLYDMRELMAEQMPPGRRRGIESSRRKDDVVSARERL